MVDHELNELKREFLVEAEEKVREMESTLSAHATSESLDRVAYLAHQLKGSGGSYGYAGISTDAAEIEKAVEEVAKGETAAAVRPKILRHVTSLRAQIEQSVRELVTS